MPASFVARFEHSDTRAILSWVSLRSTPGYDQYDKGAFSRPCRFQ